MATKIFKKKESGFSITELLVVMFILSLLSSLVLAGYRAGQKKYALSQANQRLASDIREAQNMAISGVDLAGGYYGYGIYAEPGSDFYRLYGDINGNSSFQVSDVTVKTVNLPENVRIKQTAPLGNKADVFFKSPDPDTYINGSAAAGQTAVITLEFVSASLTKSVTVTSAGLIEAE